MRYLKRFALITFLLIPVVLESGLIVNSFEAKSESLTSQNDKVIGIDDVDRLNNQVELESENGNYQQANGSPVQI